MPPYSGIARMAEPRIPMADTGELTARQHDVLESILRGPRGRIVGPLRAALHNADLAEQWQAMGRVLRYEISLPKQVRELVILLVARRWNCDLEFHLHASEAIESGVAAAVVEAIRNCAVPELGSAEARDVYRYTRALLIGADVSDEAHAAIVAHWGVVGVVELTALIGYYSMVAMTLNAHRMEPEDGALRLKPLPGLASLPPLPGDGL